MNIRGWLGRLILWALVPGACIEPYDPPLDNSDINLLVVDGFLNASDGVATVSLSRTQPVKDEEEAPRETGAQVFIQDGSQNLFPLFEIQTGVYQGTLPDMHSEEQYSLIIVSKGQEYASDYITIVETPEIDSITWSIKNDGVEFYVNTHDPSNESRFYRWKYSETYEYNSDFNSILKFGEDEIVARPPSESIFTCWKTNQSTGILVGSTKHLEQSIVSRFPITFVPQGDIRIRVCYSLLVEQQALTEDAYEYWLNLEKSTEHLGGLFDPLPSEVSGNIHCLSNPSETVIGYFGAGMLRESRMFLRRRELPLEVVGRFNGNQSCVLDTIAVNELDQIYEPTTVLVDAVYAPGAGLVGYTTAPIYCADCRTLGGNTVRPTFWE